MTGVSMRSIYLIAGISKQAAHQYWKRQTAFEAKLNKLIMDVDLLRKHHPGCGVEKMYYTLKPDWLGRDQFIAIFMELGYRVKRFKNYVRTTVPSHYKYPNLIQGMQLMDKNRLWQTDITYISIGSRFYYLVFITDVYTHKIQGYNVSDHMRSTANIKALRMAIKNVDGIISGLIHHSDRGSQYVDREYTSILKSFGIHISMGKSAQDNAYAERVNGIIKNEYLKYREITSFKQLKREVKKAVDHYNTDRIHLSLPEKLTPQEFEKRLSNTLKNKRQKMIIYSEMNQNVKSASKGLYFDVENEPEYHNCPLSFS
jgi:hypothetical protein